MHPDDCNTHNKGFGKSFYECPDCGRYWRVTTDNVAWAGWIPARGLWRLIARIATK